MNKSLFVKCCCFVLIFSQETLAETSFNGSPDIFEKFTHMEVSKDLPPRISSLGESLARTVMAESKQKNESKFFMPYDEFKIRIRDAVLSSPDVLSVDAQLAQSEAAKRETRSPLLPQISGYTDSGRRSIGRDPYLGTSAYERNGSNYGLTVRQLLFDFGAAYFGFQAGKAKELAATEMASSKKSEQVLRSVVAVIDLERARSHLRLANENAASRLAIVNLVKERYKLGGGTKPDVIRAESRYAESLANITNAKNKLKSAEEGYRELFGAKAVGIINGPNHEINLDSLDKSPQELASSYPGLRQMSYLRDAARSEADSSKWAMLPRLNLVYDNALNGISSAYGPSRNHSVVLELRYNFYTGGAESARNDGASYKASQAEQEFQAAIRQFDKIISQSQQEVRNSDDLVYSRRMAAVSAISSMRAVREQFAFNKGTLLDLLTVQESLYYAGRDLVDAEADRYVLRYRFLHLSSGLDKLFDLHESTPNVKAQFK